MNKEAYFNMERILAPSILACDPLRLADEIASLPDSVKWLHIDVMDGHFVPNMNGSPEIVRALKKITDRVLDVHLMVEKPEHVVDLYLDAGADVLTIHQEACVHAHRWLSYIRAAGAKAGLVINPGTSLHQVEELLEQTDLLLLMSVNPGFGGQKFIRPVLGKLARAKAMLERQDHKILLEVDGGVNAENAGDLWAQGVDVLVAGSSVFGKPDRVKSAEALLQA